MNAAVAFAHETPAQIARHNEIAIRYQRKAANVEKLTPQRGRMLRRRRELIRAGTWLAEHDPDYMPCVSSWAVALADVLRFLGGNADDLRRHASDAGITITGTEARDAVAEACIAGGPHPMTGTRIGRLIGLTCEQRLACGITTIVAIDETAAERAERVAEARRERDRLRKRRQRADGRTPRAAYEASSAATQKPWEAAGVSRATWYRRRETGVSPPQYVRAADAPVSTAAEKGAAQQGQSISKSIFLQRNAAALPPILLSTLEHTRRQMEERVRLHWLDKLARIEASPWLPEADARASSPRASTPSDTAHLLNTPLMLGAYRRSP